MANLKSIVCASAVTVAVAVVSAYAVQHPTMRELDGAWEPKNYSPTESLVEQFPKWQIYAGASWVDFFANTNNVTFSFLNNTLDPDNPFIETHQLVQTNKSDSAGFLFGLERMFTYANADESKMRGLSLGGGFEIATTNLSGQANQSDLQGFPPSFNYTYKARPIDLDAHVNLFLTRFNQLHMLPFVLAGAGMSIVDLSYTETLTPTGVSYFSTPHSSSDTNFTPLFLIGLGAQFDLGRSVFFRTEYAYHYRGDVHLSTGLPQSTTIPLNLNEQSVDFVLGTKI